MVEEAEEVGVMSVGVVEVDGRPVSVEAMETRVDHPVLRSFAWKAQHRKDLHLPALETGRFRAAPSRMGPAPGLEP